MDNDQIQQLLSELRVQYAEIARRMEKVEMGIEHMGTSIMAWSNETNALRRELDASVREHEVFRGDINGLGAKIGRIENDMNLLRHDSPVTKRSVMDQVWKWLMTAIGTVLVAEATGIINIIK